MSKQETIVVEYDEAEEVKALEISTPRDITAILTEAVKAHVPAEQSAQFIGTLEKLVGLHERVEANYARRQFVEAMAAFQEQCPKIPKTGILKVVTKSGGKFATRYADLEKDIYPVIHAPLARNGLTYTYDTTTENGVVTVKVAVTHIAGHSESSSFCGQIDNRENRANSPMQKTGAAITYAKRQALINALGLRTGEVDEDGLPPAQSQQPRITEQQVTAVKGAIDITGTDEEKVLKYFGIAKLEDMTEQQHKTAMSMLQDKMGA